MRVGAWPTYDQCASGRPVGEQREGVGLVGDRRQHRPADRTRAWAGARAPRARCGTGAFRIGVPARVRLIPAASSTRRVPAVRSDQPTPRCSPHTGRNRCGRAWQDRAYDRSPSAPLAAPPARARHDAVDRAGVLVRRRSRLGFERRSHTAIVRAARGRRRRGTTAACRRAPVQRARRKFVAGALEQAAQILGATAASVLVVGLGRALHRRAGRDRRTSRPRCWAAW